MKPITKHLWRRLEALEADIAKCPIPLEMARRMRDASERLLVLDDIENGHGVSTAAEREEYQSRKGQLAIDHLPERARLQNIIQEGVNAIHRAEGYRYGVSEALRDYPRWAGLYVKRKNHALRGKRPLTAAEDVLHVTLTARKLGSEHIPAVLAARKEQERLRAESQEEDFAELLAQRAEEDAAAEQLKKERLAARMAAGLPPKPG